MKHQIELLIVKDTQQYRDQHTHKHNPSQILREMERDITDYLSSTLKTKWTEGK